MLKEKIRKAIIAFFVSFGVFMVNYYIVRIGTIISTVTFVVDIVLLYFAASHFFDEYMLIKNKKELYISLMYLEEMTLLELAVFLFNFNMFLTILWLLNFIALIITTYKALSITDKE